MRKILSVLLILLMGTFLHANAWAFKRIPSTSSDEETTATVKSKKTKPVEVKKLTPPALPVATPKPKQIPVQTPASKTAPQPSLKAIKIAPEKSVPIKPSISPVQRTQEKPTVIPKTKSQPARVKKPAHSFEWIIGAGFEMGGEELGQVTYSDGSTASVHANNGIVFSIGGLIPHGDDGTFATQISIGYKSGGPRLWSTDVHWTAIPIDIIEHYRANSMRLGIGINYQLNPQLRVNLPTSSIVNKYNNAPGLLLQVGWAPVRDNYSIDLRYTSIKYESSDSPGTSTVNGSVAGLFVNYRF